MGPDEWIAAIGVLGGLVAWMTAMWIRAGRILQRIDDIANDQLLLKQQSAVHETCLTRLEVLVERKP